MAVASPAAGSLPPLEAIEDDLAFNAVLIESLDPHDQDYHHRLAELEADRTTLEGLLGLHHSHGIQHGSSPWRPLHGLDAASDDPGKRDAWWQAAMDGRPPSNQSSNGSMAADPFVHNPPGHDPPSNGIKRTRPGSSYPAHHEHASKRPTPDPPAHAGAPPPVSASSTGSPLEHERARRRRQQLEAAQRRQQAALQQHLISQQHAALARQASQPGWPHAFPPSSRPAVQTTLNFDGSYQRPPPQLLMTRSEQSSPTRQPFQSSLAASPLPGHFRIEAHPSPSRTQQRSQRPRQPTAVVDLTQSDGEDDPDDPDDDLQVIGHSLFPPHNHRPPARQLRSPPQLTSHLPPLHYRVPGSVPSSDPAYPHGNGSQMPHGNAYNNPGLYNQVANGIRSGLQTLTGGTQQLGNLLLGLNDVQLLNLDDDDDDEDDDGLAYIGHRQIPVHSNYAGQESLYRQRYDAYAAYDPSKSREELEALLANIRPDEDMPAHLRVQTPEDMSVSLHKYQELGLTWLQKQEEGSNQGGILADDMGLGKTIQMLSLIVTRKSEDPRCKTTLIIAPVALMRQWRSEIRKKLKPGRFQLTVFTHHGTRKAKDFNELRTFDVVLTTYGTIASELKKVEKFALRQKANPSVQIQPLPAEKTIFLGPQARWYRVILDEAQCIKNRNTQTSKGACQLNAKYRFCVTGTPMMNNVEEFFTLIDFLRIKPYCRWDNFRIDFATPLRSPDDTVRQQAMQKLQVLCRSIMLRRTKKSTFEGKPILNLPERTTEAVHPVFSPDEMDFYKALETKSALTFNRYLRANTVGREYSAILVLLLRLRQACCHPHLIKDFGVAAAADMSEDQMLEFARQLAEPVVERIKAANGSFECPVCYDVTANPAIFIPCGHDTCSECFAKIADPAMAIHNGDERGKARCPNCRGAIDAQHLTDFNSFKKIHMPELLTAEERAAMDEVHEEIDGDDDSETDSDSEEDEKVEDETLDGFIVDDDEDVEEGNGFDSDDLDRQPSKSKKRVVIDDETDSDDLDAKSTKVRSEVKDELLEGIAGPSAAVPAHGQKKPLVEKSKGKGQARDKGEGKKKGKKKPAITLAELKKQASRKKGAKKKYLRRLRKEWVSSAKVEKTMEILEGIMKNQEGEKVLIFSQWTSLLDLLEIPIDEQKYGYRRYDGSMTAGMRGDAVDDFSDPQKNIRIMLVSLKAGNAGLNLNMASQVIILDPFWNPFIEEQAVDRAHRIGQTRPVKVHRILIQQTVEDRIIELQERKAALISEALDEQQSQQLGRLGVRELAYLFGVTTDPTQDPLAEARQHSR